MLDEALNAERTIKGLRTQIRNLKLEKRVAWAQVDELKQAPPKGAMPSETIRLIQKALHPDTRPTDAERLAAMQAFNAWLS